MAGGLLLFCLLALIGVCFMRRRFRRRGQRISKSNEHGHVDMDLKAALKITQPTKVKLPRRLSFSPLLPLSDGNLGLSLVSHNMPQQPSKATRSHLQRPFFRVSGVKDPWPLASHNFIPLAMLPNQSTMVLSPVAPPGYIIQDRGPNRSSSRISRRKSAISVDTTSSRSPNVTRGIRSPSSSPSQSPLKSPKRLPKRSLAKNGDKFNLPTPHKPLQRATSETQLSTILRSTSERLETARRQTLTRTLTTISKFPGILPLERHPDPSMRLTTESREQLIDKEYTESLRSSNPTDFPSRTPSPGKETWVISQESCTQSNPLTQSKSPTPSNSSRDSLCATDTPDLFIPAPLTSPSRSLRIERTRQSGMHSLSSSGDVSAGIHNGKDNSSLSCSIESLDHAEIENPKIPHCISLASDPFYSSVKSSKPIIPRTRIQGPRPMYFRKATFGHEATLERPSSLSSPLKERTENCLSHSKRQATSPPSSPQNVPEREEIELNPFQWLPQEASKSISVLPSSKYSGGRRRGHKRSTTVRISNLPVSSRPPSIVEVVDEDSECSISSNPLSLGSGTAPVRPPFELYDRISSLKLSSSPILEHSLDPPSLASGSIETSTKIGFQDTTGSKALSVTSARSDDYIDNMLHGSNSADGTFNIKPLNLLKPSPTTQSFPITNMQYKNAREQPHNQTWDPLPPFNPETDRHEEKKQSSFLPPQLKDRPTPVLSPPSKRARTLPDITSDTKYSVTPTLSLLPVPLPSQSKSLDATINSQCTLQPRQGGESPPRNSLHASISALRRMNSDVSQCSIFSVSSNDLSSVYPTYSLKFVKPSPSHASIQIEVREDDSRDPEHERGQTRGSRHYLALGSQSSLALSVTPSMAVPSKITTSNSHHLRTRGYSGPGESAGSHRVHKARRRRKIAVEPEPEVDRIYTTTTPTKDKTGDRGMDWEFDDVDRDDKGTSNWDTSLTPVKEVSSPLEMNRRNPLKSKESLGCRDNALLIMGLEHSTLQIEADQRGICVGPDRISTFESHRKPEVTDERHDTSLNQCRKERDISKSSNGFGFEAFMPVVGRAQSIKQKSPSLSSPTSNDIQRLGAEQVTSWSNTMTKPTINVTRAESKIEHPVPQTRWGLSALGIPGLGLAAARLLGSGNQRIDTPSVKTDWKYSNEEEGKENVTFVEGTERPESLGLYDHDGFLRNSPDRELRNLQKWRD
jgi:hypothetical protein